MSISVNFYSSIKQFGNNYINDIERTYKHKVTYSVIEKGILKYLPEMIKLLVA